MVAKLTILSVIINKTGTDRTYGTLARSIEVGCTVRFYLYINIMI